MATKVKTAKHYRKEITKSVGIIHDEIITISDELVEGTIATASKWQKLWAKAIKNSQPILSKQMDITYDALNSVKGQIKVSGKRIKKLIAEEGTVKTTVAKKVRKTAKKVAKKAPAKRATKATAKRTKTAPKRATTKRKAVAKTDNLRLIEGVGPKLESILKKNGIKTYKDLAKARVTSLRAILESAGPRYNMHNPKTWATQAKFAAAGKFSDLVKYQATLNNKK